MDGWSLRRRRLKRVVLVAIKTLFYWFLCLIFGFLIIYIKLPVDVLLESLVEISVIPQDWTMYDTLLENRIKFKWYNQEVKWVQIFKFGMSEVGFQNRFMKLFEQLGQDCLNTNCRKKKKRNISNEFNFYVVFD